MFLFQVHTQRHVQLQIAVVENVTLHVKVEDQFFYLSRRHPKEAVLILKHLLFLDHHALWCQWVGVMRVMELCRVFQVDLDDETLWVIGRVVSYVGLQLLAVLHPTETTCGNGWLMTQPYWLFTSR